MEIEFVNHSSFIVSYKGKRIICDPWLEGTVFNNGWDLISPTKFRYEDFSTIDFIWFSHEHPDHFFPPNIKKISKEFRKNITVLFQHTLDKRVVEWCRAQEFKEVIELLPGKWFTLHEDFRVLCEPFTEGDSWICFKTDTLTYLNTNDCGIVNKNEANHIQSQIGKTNVLLTQFSYAYWAGNADEKAFRKKVADDKLEALKFQCNVFQPEYIIPIASFIYFSHEENKYLNDEVNTAKKTYQFIREKTKCKPVVLYNGEKWNYGQAHDSEKSCLLYEADFSSVMQKGFYHKTEKIPAEDLEKHANAFIDELNKNNRFYLKRNIHPAHIYITDYHQSYTLGLNGFSKKNTDEKNADVAISSGNLLFCIKFPYGLDTTQINGRLQKPRGGNYTRFYNLFRINQLKSRGIDPNKFSYLAAAVTRKILQKLRLRKMG